jgi:ribulose-phosphate 3-epimerase
MNQPPIRICASLACADWLHLEHDLLALEAASVDYVHIDVMDGTFVPNYALNMDNMRAVRRVSRLPLDVHLMIEKPERYLEAFVDAGADILVVHEEASPHLQRTLARIESLGARAGVALNVHTPVRNLEYVLENIDLLLIMTVNPGFAGQKLVPSALRKIADARALFDAAGLGVDIEVDGNVSLENAQLMVQAGANYLVGGTSSIFRSNLTIAEGTARLRRAAEIARSV